MSRKLAQPQLTKFCRKCLKIQDQEGTAICPSCGGTLGALFDSTGALSAEYLRARGRCCESYCRNCPFGNDLTALLRGPTTSD